MACSPQPNLLLITTDQHNAEVMGCAGHPWVRTPHLDRLAAEGVVFDAAFTPHPVCTPARASIFTGQYARQHGVWYNLNLREDRPDPTEWTGIRADAVAFPEVLVRHGYATAFFGKLHCSQAGSRNLGLQVRRLAEGKGQFAGPGNRPDDYRRYLLDRGYPASIWRTWERPEYARQGWVRSPLPAADTIDAWTAAEAVDWLSRHDPTVPFFAWVSFSGPHTPWDPPEPYASMYRPADLPLPCRRPGELEEKHSRWVDHLARTIPAIPPRSIDPDRPGGRANAYARFPDDQVRAMLAAYGGQVSHIDAGIGRLLSCLADRGLRRNTLVLFTADHGDHLGNNWAFFKYGVPYDSLARVPFILSHPEHVPAGGHSAELVSLVDVAPTLLRAAGAEPVDPVAGRPLQELITGQGAPWRQQLPLPGQPRGLVTADWLYIRWDDGFEELYDRRGDPHSLHNRLADRGPADVRPATELRARMEASQP